MTAIECSTPSGLWQKLVAIFRGLHPRLLKLSSFRALKEAGYKKMKKKEPRSGVILITVDFDVSSVEW
jgi:hypothetical protein